MRLSTLPLPLRLATLGAATAVLLWLSLAPADELPPITFWDKAEHALAYTVLTGLGLALFPARARTLAVSAMALGIAIEVAQAVMALGRQGDWRDAVADGLGVLAALALAMIARRAGGALQAANSPNRQN